MIISTSNLLNPEEKQYLSNKLEILYRDMDRSISGYIRKINSFDFIATVFSYPGDKSHPVKIEARIGMELNDVVNLILKPLQEKYKDGVELSLSTYTKRGLVYVFKFRGEYSEKLRDFVSVLESIRI